MPVEVDGVPHRSRSPPATLRPSRSGTHRAVIQFFHVGKRFPGGQVALDDVTFSLLAGGFAFLTGASGAGKTTLLRLIYRGDVPSTGRILVNGRNVASLPRGKIPYLRRTIGVVFQSFRLIERKTVFENVSYLPRLLGADRESQRRSALWALQRVGLAHRMSAFPQELSGGEQQRVAIARAIIARPDVLIADEPTGNLDPDLSWEIVRLFLEIHRQGTTVLVATHDRSMIERVGGRVLSLEAGRLGRDEEVPGSAPEALASPTSAPPAPEALALPVPPAPGTPASPAPPEEPRS